MSEYDSMLTHRKLIWDQTLFSIDYGQEKTEIVMQMFKDIPIELMGCLMWPGVGTRYEIFYEYLMSEGDLTRNAVQCFKDFGDFLGRVVSYRALSLTEEQYQVIVREDSIWPTGRLREPMDRLEQLVDTKGVWFIAHARLYIGRRLVPYDPSLSLHDDPETAVTIASGYLAPGKKLYLMELDIPKIEVLGYVLADVQDDDKVWFTFRGVKFNSFWERTERYTLYEIPHYQQRLRALTIFNTNNDIETFIAPFRASQLELYNEWLEQQQSS